MSAPRTTRVWYHSGCADGFGAAWALWKILGDDAVYVPVRYGDDPPEWHPGDVVWIVDFSYKREVLQRMAAADVDLTVIDHHATAAEELADLPYAHFDAARSGAVATWDHVHGNLRPGDPGYYRGRRDRLLLLYVQDRDLWRWEMPDSRAVNCAIAHIEWSFDVWSKLEIDDLKERGTSMLAAIDKIVDMTASRAVPLRLAGHDALVVNSACLPSEIGHVLAERSESGIGVVWYHDGDRFRWELRSLDRGPHVGHIAKTFGGGGHPNAAGFRTDSLTVVSS